MTLKRFLGPLAVLVLLVAACTQTPPGLRVTTMSPVDGATDVPLDAVVTATFNAGIDQSTLSGAFSLSSDDGEVDGTLSYDANQRTATFSPSAPLADDTIYTAALAGSLQATNGGRLPIPVNGEYSWSFTTGVAPGSGVTAVEVSPGTADLAPTETQQFTATVTAVGGADDSVTWLSSNEDVATVDADGLVTAVAVGDATITATSVFDATVSGSATVNVVAPAVTDVTVAPAAAAVFVGEDVQLEAVVDTVGGASTEVDWSSDDEAVATVDADGLVTGVGLGAATITATSVFDATVSGSATVTVADEPTVVSLTIEDPGDVYETDVLTLEADVVVLGDLSTEVTWLSSDPTVATIDEETGELEALEAGTTTITATSVEDPEVFNTLELEVLAATVVSVVVAPDALSLDVAESGQLGAEVTAFGGADESVEWSSDDDAVATVDADGLVTGVAIGTTTIIATSSFDGTVFGTAAVEVVGLIADDYVTEGEGYEVNTAVSIDAPAVSGGDPPYAFALSDGALPTGLDLIADGSITGTPTEAGTFTGTVTVTDAADRTATAEFSIVVNPAVEFALNPYVGLTVEVGENLLPQELVVTGVPQYTYEVITVDPDDPDLPEEWADRYGDGTWSLHDVADQGPLAADLVADADDGMLSGVIAEPAGFYRTYLQVTDDLGRVDVVQIEVSVNVGP